VDSGDFVIFPYRLDLSTSYQQKMGSYQHLSTSYQQVTNTPKSVSYKYCKEFGNRPYCAIVIVIVYVRFSSWWVLNGIIRIGFTMSFFGSSLRSSPQKNMVKGGVGV